MKLFLLIFEVVDSWNSTETPCIHRKSKLNSLETISKSKKPWSCPTTNLKIQSAPQVLKGAGWLRYSKKREKITTKHVQVPARRGPDTQFELNKAALSRRSIDQERSSSRDELGFS